MNKTAATWIRTQVWTPAVRADARSFGPECLCRNGFVTALCSGGMHAPCADSPFTILGADTWLRGPRGLVYNTPRTPGSPDRAPLSLWLADRTCIQRCNCSCHSDTPAAPEPEPTPEPVQLGLFGTAA